MVAGEDEAWPDDLLALEAGAIDTPIEGRAVKDPSFGLDARWIDPALRDLAIASGYTVVDAATVIGTHLNHLLTGQAQVLLGQDEVQKLLDTLAETQPQLVGGLVPNPRRQGDRRRRRGRRQRAMTHPNPHTGD